MHIFEESNVNRANCAELFPNFQPYSVLFRGESLQSMLREGNAAEFPEDQQYVTSQELMPTKGPNSSRRNKHPVNIASTFVSSAIVFEDAVAHYCGCRSTP